MMVRLSLIVGIVFWASVLFAESQTAMFAENRMRFLAALPEGSVAVFPAAPKVIRSSDLHYPYSQDRDFYYLSGFAESDAILVLQKSLSGEAKFILFNLPSDPEEEVWDGKRVGQSNAKEVVGVDEAYSIYEADKKIPALLENMQHIYFPVGRYPEFNKKVAKWREGTGQNQGEILDSSSILSELRVIKSGAEIAEMEHAAQVSAEAHVELMKSCKPGMTEYQIASLFSHYCSMRGCTKVSYETIVGGGHNACILHYVDNSSDLKDGDLVLVDAGAESRYYTSDITRTFPVNGKFTPDQRAIYEIVLAAQKAGIDALKPGAHWFDVMRIVRRVLVMGLMDLRILEGDFESIIKSRTYEQYTLHGYSHWLGLDTHDVGSYVQTDHQGGRKLEPGMVLTMEPGIYIREGSKVDPKWIGIGVRIEDDILITENGHQVLSSFAPKEIDEIENLMERR